MIPMKVLMVCLGNICRSPLAEGILRHKVEKKNLDWTIESAGTGSWHVGEKPDSRSVSTAHKNGIDISKQRARRFQPADLDHFDLIYAMDGSNFRDILKHAVTKEQEEKVKMIMNEVKPGYNEAVPDPYWNDDGFDRVFEMLDSACEEVLKKYS